MLLGNTVHRQKPQLSRWKSSRAVIFKDGWIRERQGIPYSFLVPPHIDWKFSLFLIYAHGCKDAIISSISLYQQKLDDLDCSDTIGVLQIYRDSQRETIMPQYVQYITNKHEDWQFLAGTQRSVWERSYFATAESIVLGLTVNLPVSFFLLVQLFINFRLFLSSFFFQMRFPIFLLLSSFFFQMRCTAVRRKSLKLSLGRCLTFLW